MKTARLGDLVEITIGRTPSRSDDSLWDKDKSTSNVWLSIADMPTSGNRRISNSKEYISDVAAQSFAIVPKGTLLVSFKLTLGRLAYADIDLRTNEAIAALRNNEKAVLNDYLYHYLSHFNWSDYASADQKVKGFTLNKAKLAEIRVIYPESFEDQRSTVARLDAAFNKIAQAEILMKQNIENVSFLQKSILAKYLDSANDTHTHRLGDILIIERGGSPRPIKEYITNAGDGINWIKIGDVAPGAKYIESTLEKIKPDGLRKSRKVEVGDFILSNSMSFGRPYIMKISGAIHDGWLLLRQKDRTLDKDFLYYLLSSDQTYKQFDRLASGSTVRNLNTQTVARVEIRYPKDITEQKEIALRLDEAFSNTDRLLNSYDYKLKRLTDLRRSILYEAFAG